MTHDDLTQPHNTAPWALFLQPHKLTLPPHQKHQFTEHQFLVGSGPGSFLTFCIFSRCFVYIIIFEMSMLDIEFYVCM